MVVSHPKACHPNLDFGPQPTSKRNGTAFGQPTHRYLMLNTVLDCFKRLIRASCEALCSEKMIARAQAESLKLLERQAGSPFLMEVRY